MQSLKQSTGTNNVTVIEITNADIQNILGRQVPDNMAFTILILYNNTE